MPQTIAFRVRALDVDVDLRVDDRASAAVTHALGPLIVETDAPVDDDAIWAIEADGSTWWLWPGRNAPSWAASPEGLMAPLVHELNQLVAQQSGCVALHAGGVTHSGVAILLPGPMESGKSTLTAGLVRAGCGYLSDEAVGIDERSGSALPYPKPIALDVGAQPLFPELAGAAARYRPQPGGAWHVPPFAIGPGSLGSTSPVRLLVFSRYVLGAPTRVERVSRADAVVEAARSTFRFRQRARRCLDTLAAVVQGADCHRVVTGDLAPAVDAVLGLAEEVDR